MTLRMIRIGIAAVFFAAMVFFFLDFTQTLPNGFAFFERIQLVPAILAGAFFSLAALAVLTLIFGRLYCSVICPLGIFQDVIARMTRLFFKRKYTYAPGHTRVRYLFFVLAAGLGILSAGWLGFFDPYAIFGRTVNLCLAPLWRSANNFLASHGATLGGEPFYRVDYIRTSGVTLAVSAVTLVLIVGLAAKYGRLYCNTFCPVGALLGFLSRFALLKIRIDQTKCVSCGKCAGFCKGSCIDSKEKRIDTSRCVVCFDCLTDCPKKAIFYSLPRATPTQVRTPKKDESAAVSDAVQASGSSEVKESKRRFLSTLFAISAAACGISRVRWAHAAEAPAISYNGHVPYKREGAISPPGSVSYAHFQTRCVSCHLCVAKCPSKALAPSLWEYGPAGILQPTVVFTDHSFCNFDCTICGEVCPTGAILPLTKEQKHVEQIGRVEFIPENCVVVTDGTNCGACAEHCPTQAVHMIAYKGALTIPEIAPELCVGCGACESICPVRPFRAIHVEGLAVHGKATPPPAEKKQEIKIDDFGF